MSVIFIFFIYKDVEILLKISSFCNTFFIVKIQKMHKTRRFPTSK